MNLLQSMIIIIILGLLLTVFHFGTKKLLNEQTQPSPEKIVDKRKKYNSTDIFEYYLEDGTRCAVLLGYRMGGLTCDWK